jgi:hydroxymethylpyrimidine/phosphomethylpyrimidine kinase
MKRILTIAGSDSGGGAGIQADLKTITVLGGYGLSVVTALTAQNTIGVQAIEPVANSFIEQQLDSVLSDIGADAVKTGMLATPAVVETVVAALTHFGVQPVVVDPVMVAKGGDLLVDQAALQHIKNKLLPLAQIVTPNVREAALLADMTLQSNDDLSEAARRIIDLGPRGVVIKGGFAPEQALDLFYDGDRMHQYSAQRIDTRSTHGTGCTFSAALATYLAQGYPPTDAVARAKRFVQRAILTGPAIGSGYGPTNHYAEIQRQAERREILAALQKALDEIQRQPLGALIPEVRSNFGYAMEDAQNYDEVAAVPGRISQIGARLVVAYPPAFGASRHIARVILAALKHNHDLRAVLNIRYSEEILAACRRAGLKLIAFDRNDEPADVKAKEGSTLEWGTHQALASAVETPDLVYDEGDLGKEPMIRILATDPQAVVSKLLRIATAMGLPLAG